MMRSSGQAVRSAGASKDLAVAKECKQHAVSQHQVLHLLNAQPAVVMSPGITPVHRPEDAGRGEGNEALTGVGGAPEVGAAPVGVVGDGDEVVIRGQEGSQWPAAEGRWQRLPAATS